MVKTIWVSPSTRKAGVWTVGLVGFPTDGIGTRKTLNGAIALAKRFAESPDTRFNGPYEVKIHNPQSLPPGAQ